MTRYVDLARHTTLRLGGRAEFHKPADIPSLIELLRRHRVLGQRYHLLGNGSNVLVNDAGLRFPVIATRHLKGLRFDPPYVEAEAGCMLPTLLRSASERNLGGLEFLASVPGTVGGGVCMNAGRGGRARYDLHQRIESVTCFDGARVRVLGPGDLKTGYRWSLFREDPTLCVLSVRLKLEFHPQALVQRRIAERLRLARSREDHSGPNAGSVFRTTKDASVFGGLSVGGARFSEKTPNWIVNRGATFREILSLIRRAGRDDELEWDVWDE